MEKPIKLAYWRKKRVDEMSKEELIEALTDAYNLWLKANERGIQNMVRMTKTIVEIRSKSFLQRLFSL